MSVVARTASFRPRAAVSPLRRQAAAAVVRRPTVDQFIAAERPEEPVHCLRPAVIAANARTFVEAFPGDALYAVKCNPDPAVLRALHAGGVRHFDCASLQEVRLVRDMFPDAAIHFMHPVKARGAIREAWERHGVRDFVLDSAEELAKIRAEAAATGLPGRLGLIVRIALPKGGARLDLSGKFGAEPEDAAALLRAARGCAATLGVSFHVGSQCLDPLAWRAALGLAGQVIRTAGVAIDVVDVGGGFPVSYPDQEPPALGAFFAEIEEGFDRLGVPAARLWAEPGRVLVASGASVVVQVQARRGAMLYVNDGVYGSLSDAGALGFRYPVRMIRPDAKPIGALTEFSLYGPTCDSADVMRGPFVLPADVAEGDWIEIGQLGAYGACLRTAFNGFDRARIVEVADRPMLDGPACGTESLRIAA
ncbi:type III PLP-dependent enzyme [Rhodopila globiformis]|uniref:ornithine decarboxylase n=1 Tax=Rhodopila globiformis TaxID=1071 RepID=A0A2S6N1H9_RHOGL|nr:type III PLP-dependent enzyme [Rhodopila globiformis]PPQ28450.1 decarboxylase [Rhodopila globiformis]